MSSAVEFPCINCQRTISATRDHVLGDIRCPHCESLQYVPDFDSRWPSDAPDDWTSEDERRLQRRMTGAEARSPRLLADRWRQLAAALWVQIGGVLGLNIGAAAFWSVLAVGLIWLTIPEQGKIGEVDQIRQQPAWMPMLVFLSFVLMGLGGLALLIGDVLSRFGPGPARVRRGSILAPAALILAALSGWFALVNPPDERPLLLGVLALLVVSAVSMVMLHFGQWHDIAWGLRRKRLARGINMQMAATVVVVLACAAVIFFAPTQAKSRVDILVPLVILCTVPLATASLLFWYGLMALRCLGIVRKEVKALAEQAREDDRREPL